MLRWPCCSRASVCLFILICPLLSRLRLRCRGCFVDPALRQWLFWPGRPPCSPTGESLLTLSRTFYEFMLAWMFVNREEATSGAVWIFCCCLCGYSWVLRGTLTPAVCWQAPIDHSSYSKQTKSSALPPPPHHPSQHLWARDRLQGTTLGL